MTADADLDVRELRHRPRAEIVGLDWANVLEVAAQAARATGVSDGYRTLPGSAFDVEYGSDYDLALITRFLHHFDVPANETLLCKVRAASKTTTAMFRL